MFYFCTLPTRSRTAIANVRLDFNKRRANFISFSRFNRRAEYFKVVAVLNCQSLEIECRDALLNVFAKRNVRGAFNRDSVAVLQDNQRAQADSARQRQSLRQNSFH